MEIKDKSKKELLAEVEQLEIDHISKMSESQFLDNYADWFGLDEDEMKEREGIPMSKLFNNYMNSFMEYKYSYDEDELKDHIANHKQFSEEVCDECGEVHSEDNDKLTIKK
jgi:hypothetical protein